jgi:hypothetical protein
MRYLYKKIFWHIFCIKIQTHKSYARTKGKPLGHKKPPPPHHNNELSGQINGFRNAENAHAVRVLEHNFFQAIIAAPVY